MAEEIGTFTPAQSRALWQDYQTRQALKPSLQNNTRDRMPLAPASSIVTGATIGTITAATSALTGATTFTFALLQKNSAGNLEDSTLRLTGTNRDMTLTALDGTLLYLARIDGEWRPTWVGCEPDPDLEALT